MFCSDLSIKLYVCKYKIRIDFDWIFSLINYIIQLSKKKKILDEPIIQRFNIFTYYLVLFDNNNNHTKLLQYLNYVFWLKNCSKSIFGYFSWSKIAQIVFVFHSLSNDFFWKKLYKEPSQDFFLKKSILKSLLQILCTLSKSYTCDEKINKRPRNGSIWKDKLISTAALSTIKLFAASACSNFGIFFFQLLNNRQN